MRPKAFSRWFVHFCRSVSASTATTMLKWVYTSCLLSRAITSCTREMSSTAIWLLGFGMLACRFFFLSSNDSSRFWLGRKITWLYTTVSAFGMLSMTDTRSTGISVLFTSILV